MAASPVSSDDSDVGADESTFLDDIKALGGDESDLKLLKGIPKDWQSKDDGSFVNAQVQRELATLVKSLGFDKLQKTSVVEVKLEEETKDEIAKTEENEKESKEMRQLRVRVERKNPPSGKGWLGTPNPLWHEIELPIIYPAPITAELTEDQISKVKEYAKSLLNDLPSSLTFIPASDAHFISTLLSSTTSTSSDRISALTLLVSQAPLNAVSQLTAILNTCRKKGREESGRAVRAIVDWLTRSGGLPDRKLKVFEDQPQLEKVGGWALHLGLLDDSRNEKKSKGKGKVSDEGMLKDEVDAILTVWAFEDFLKGWFFEILKTIEHLTHDPITHVRNQQVSHLSLLLKSKPEQEQNILALLVNKLGDLDKGVASKASHELLQTLQYHPMMKSIIIREVANLILRPTSTAITPSSPPKKDRHKKRVKDQKNKSSSVAVIQKPKDANEHAKYYGIITLNQIVLTKAKDGEAANKMIEVYFEMFEDVLGRCDTEEKEKEKSKKENEEKDSDGDGDEQEESGKKNLKRKRFEGDNKRKGGGKKDMPASQDVGEEDSKFLAAILTGVNRAFPYSNFNDELLDKRMDILFRVTHTGTLNVMIQALQLIYTISSARKKVSVRFFRTLYDSLLDPRLETSPKQALYLNLVFKALKVEESFEILSAFVKRLLQTLAHHQPPYVCGALFLISELFRSTPRLKTLLDAKSITPGEPEENKGNEKYDARKRDPQFAHAENTCFWELTSLRWHYHPTVAFLTEVLLNDEAIDQNYGELEKRTVTHLVDRFAYRSAKKERSNKGASLMQSGVKGQDRSGMVSLRKSVGMLDEVGVNERRFWRMERSKVEPDVLFFHTFFNLKHDKDDDDGVEEKKEEEDEFDVKSVASDEEENEEEEQEIWKAMKASLPVDEDVEMPMDEDDYAVDEDDEDLEGFDNLSFDFSGEEEDDFDEEQEDVVVGGSDAESGLDAEAEEGKAEGKKRRKRAKLPLFANVEEYSHLLED